MKALSFFTIFTKKTGLKNIIITGTSRGIGYELALLFANEGHQVLAVSRNLPDILLAHPNITCLSVDLSQEQDLKQVADFLSRAWKNVDGIIHNAGALILKSFSETTTQDFEKIFKVNVFAVAALTRLCLPYLKKGSHVVSISSMGGIQGSMKFSGLSAYLHHQEIAAATYLSMSKMKHFSINNYNKFEPITRSFFGKRSQMVVLPFFDVTVASPP